MPFDLQKLLETLQVSLESFCNSNCHAKTLNCFVLSSELNLKMKCFCFPIVVGSGLSTTMGVCFIRFRRISLHRPVTQLEPGLVVIQFTSKEFLCIHSHYNSLLY